MTLDVIATEPPPDVRPLTIYAAARRKFAALTPGNVKAQVAADLIFHRLKLREHGWRKGATTIRAERKERDGTVWIMERLDIIPDEPA